MAHLLRLFRWLDRVFGLPLRIAVSCARLTTAIALTSLPKAISRPIPSKD
jgi:hypothetical protein